MTSEWKPKLFDELTGETAGELTPEDVDIRRQLSDISNRDLLVKTIVGTWEKQQNTDRNIRRTYASWIMGLVTVQVCIASVSFFLIGLGLIEVDQWVANVFVTAILTETLGMAFFVVKYLFGQEDNSLENLVNLIKMTTRENSDGKNNS